MGMKVGNRNLNAGLVKDNLALQRLTKRLRDASKVTQMNNSSLRAGLPMYYYCRLCGLIADVLPESYWVVAPKTYCNECRDLKTANPRVTEVSLLELAKKYRSGGKRGVRPVNRRKTNKSYREE